ncbi:594_t:CDS:2, partial [Cetraspora pellucida]
SAIAKKQSGCKPFFGALKLDELKKMVTQDTKHHRLSTQEIKDLWNKEKNQSVSIVTICYALKKAGLRLCVIEITNGITLFEFDESCLVPTVGQSPGLMFWTCFLLHGLGPIVPIYGKVNDEVYVKLIRKHVLHAQEVERCLQNSPDKPTSIDDLEKKVIAAWYSIPCKFYCGLMNSVVH